MIKTFFSKVMSVGKATVFTTGLAVVLALILGVATTAIAAAPGDLFRLGKVNVINRVTKLVGEAKSPRLVIDNNGTGVALRLQVKPGRPPMNVNSGAKVRRLNADKLDGEDSSEILPLVRAQRDGNPSLPDIQTESATQINEVSITVPTDGFLVIWNSTMLKNRSDGLQDFIVAARLDGDTSGRAAAVVESSNDSANEQSAALNVTLPVSAGEHTVTVVAQRLQRVGPSGPWSFNGNNLSVMFVPAGRGELTETES